MLAVAREVFAEDGYHGAAMEQIAQRAGVTKPVLYQHFAGKKELYLALLEADMTKLLTQVSEAIESATTNVERIRRGVESYFNFIEANVDSSDPEFRETIDRFHDAAAERVGRIIAEDSGKPVEISELLARGIIGMAEAAASLWLDRKQQIAKDELVKDVAELAWRGLAGLPRVKEE